MTGLLLLSLLFGAASAYLANVSLFWRVVLGVGCTAACFALLAFIVACRAIAREGSEVQRHDD